MSVYKVIELIGTSNKSWQDAADKAVRKAQQTLSDIRVAEVTEQDMDVADGSITYRTKLRVSFKFKDDSADSTKKSSKKGSKKRS